MFPVICNRSQAASDVAVVDTAALSLDVEFYGGLGADAPEAVADAAAFARPPRVDPTAARLPIATKVSWSSSLAESTCVLCGRAV